MKAHEDDLAVASEYLNARNASVKQLTELALRLQNHASELEGDPDCCSSTRAHLRLQAAQLLNQAARMQSSLLDDVQRVSNLLNDRRLADGLELDASTLSRMRSGHLRIGATLIISIHELTGWPVRNIKTRLNLSCLPSLAAYQAAAK